MSTLNSCDRQGFKIVFIVKKSFSKRFWPKLARDILTFRRGPAWKGPESCFPAIWRDRLFFLDPPAGFGGNKKIWRHSHFSELDIFDVFGIFNIFIDMFDIFNDIFDTFDMFNHIFYIFN